MKNAAYLLIGFLIILFSGAIFNFMDIPFFHAHVDLLFLYITFLALFIGSERASLIGMVLGFLMDIFLGRYVGFHSLILFVAGLCYGAFKDKIFKERFGGAVLLLLCGVFIYNIFSVLLYKTKVFSFSVIGFKLVLVMALNLLVGSILYYPLKSMICKIEQ